jgi:hypothetical protein
VPVDQLAAPAAGPVLLRVARTTTASANFAKNCEEQCSNAPGGGCGCGGGGCGGGGGGDVGNDVSWP